jgi:hypothetical protein
MPNPTRLSLDFHFCATSRGRAGIIGGRVKVDEPHGTPESQSDSPELEDKREAQVGMVEDYVEES